jgi:hypothetical protein
MDAELNSPAKEISIIRTVMVGRDKNILLNHLLLTTLLEKVDSIKES